ncbi:MAG: hypothetical protein WCJ09_26920, partial [Planctomycetota bacterium]
GRDESTAMAEHILRVVQKSGWQEFTRQQLHHVVRRRVTNPDELDGPLKKLTDHGFVREVPQRKEGSGRKPSPMYEVNPQIITDDC